MKRVAISWFSTLTCLLFVLSLCGTASAEVKMIDDFRGQLNLLGGKNNVYQQAPSRSLATRKEVERNGKKEMVLMIKYDKKNSGGPSDTGGWCGYYTLLKIGDTYFDASSYKSLSFYVKGEKGDENFRVGLADKHWDTIGDSVKSEDIGDYLKAGKITIDWQKAVIPLDVFLLDYKELNSIAICFEGECFPEGSGIGTIYIDDITLE